MVPPLNTSAVASYKKRDNLVVYPAQLVLGALKNADAITQTGRVPQAPQQDAKSRCARHAQSVERHKLIGSAEKFAQQPNVLVSETEDFVALTVGKTRLIDV